MSIEEMVQQCRTLRAEQKWPENLELSKQGITADPAAFARANLTAQWQLLEEHALALYNLDRKLEAREYFDRILEYHLPQDDMERTLANLTYCPEPEKKFSWKQYLTGLLVASLVGVGFFLRTCHK